MRRVRYFSVSLMSRADLRDVANAALRSGRVLQPFVCPSFDPLADGVLGNEGERGKTCGDYLFVFVYPFKYKIPHVRLQPFHRANHIPALILPRSPILFLSDTRTLCHSRAASLTSSTPFPVALPSVSKSTPLFSPSQAPPMN